MSNLNTCSTHIVFTVFNIILDITDTPLDGPQEWFWMQGMVTHAVPIYESFAIPYSIMQMDIAGRDVSHYLRQLRKEGYNFHTSAEFELVRTMK